MFYIVTDFPQNWVIWLLLGDFPVGLPFVWGLIDDAGKVYYAYLAHLEDGEIDSPRYLEEISLGYNCILAPSIRDGLKLDRRGGNLNQYFIGHIIKRLHIFVIFFWAK